MAKGFRDPLGNGAITYSPYDSDGFYALRVFLKPDIDDGNKTGVRHLGIDWNANRNDDELAYATFDGTVAWARADAGGDRGGVVVLNHTLADGSKYTTVYMHLEHIPAGILNGTTTSVSRGDFLGDSGFVKTGQGLHVHYEVREGHQTGSKGLGYGYYGGATQSVLVGSGVTSDGIHYGVIQHADGTTVRYFDPIEFTERFRDLPDQAVAKADLVIQNARIDDSSVHVGQDVRVDWEVRNIGNGSAGSSVAGVYLSKDATWNSSDIRVDFNSTTPLGKGAVDAGESDTFTIPTLSAGTWYVLIVADDERSVSESNESNNVWSKQIIVSGATGRPDLVIQGAKIDDTTVRQGQDVRVDWEVKNIGTASAPASVAGIYLSKDASWSKSTDIRVDFNSTTALGKGASDTGESDSFAIPKNLAPGTWYVLIVADEDSAVAESSESNNVWSKAITVSKGSSKIRESIGEPEDRDDSDGLTLLVFDHDAPSGGGAEGDMLRLDGLFESDAGRGQADFAALLTAEAGLSLASSHHWGELPWPGTDLC